MRKIKQIFQLIRIDIVSILFVSTSLFVLFILMTLAQGGFIRALSDYDLNRSSTSYTAFSSAIHGKSLINSDSYSSDEEAEYAKATINQLAETYNNHALTYFRTHSNGTDYVYVLDDNVLKTTVKSYNLNEVSNKISVFNQEFVLETMGNEYDYLLRAEGFVEQGDQDTEGTEGTEDTEVVFVLMNSGKILELFEYLAPSNIERVYYFLESIINNTIWESGDPDGIANFKEITTNNMFYVLNTQSREHNVIAEVEYFLFRVIPSYVLFFGANLICVILLLYTLYYSLNRRFSLAILYGASKANLATFILPIGLIVILGAWVLGELSVVEYSRKIALIASFAFFVGLLVFISVLLKPEQLIKEIRNR